MNLVQFILLPWYGANAIFCIYYFLGDKYHIKYTSRLKLILYILLVLTICMWFLLIHQTFSMNRIKG